MVDTAYMAVIVFSRHASVFLSLMIPKADASQDGYIYIHSNMSRPLISLCMNTCETQPGNAVTCCSYYSDYFYMRLNEPVTDI